MSQDFPFTITTFYRFQKIDEASLAAMKDSLEQKAVELDIRGLILLGTEGINATIAGSPAAIETYKLSLNDALKGDPLFFKDSAGPKNPFRLMRVKVREEIVTLGRPDLIPYEKTEDHLSPAEWDQWLKRDDVQLLDTRNTYETELGVFRHAIDPQISEFQEFPERVKQLNLSKEDPVLIYCTGGIRCEKAYLELKGQGFKQVKQLDGGILNYLSEFPDQQFEGECFVFDHRVAVDQKLNPSPTYSLCPHCGQPGKEVITCRQCGTLEKVCDKCLAIDAKFETCSKNCAHHYSLGHKSKKPHLDSLKKRGRAPAQR